MSRLATIIRNSTCDLSPNQTLQNFCSIVASLFQLSGTENLIIPVLFFQLHRSFIFLSFKCLLFSLLSPELLYRYQIPGLLQQHRKCTLYHCFLPCVLCYAEQCVCALQSVNFIKFSRAKCQKKYNNHVLGAKTAPTFGKFQRDSTYKAYSG